MPSLLDRFQGCMLGHAVGDALGAPFEGLPSESIFGNFGRPADIIANPPVEEMFCTDDTHMAFALAQVLCDAGTADEEKLIHAFADGFDPKRGYGQGMMKLLEAVKFNEDWRTLAATMFGAGSYGNGGAMRAAPVGLLFHQNLDRVWHEAGKSAAVTHRHPLGIEGAQILATAVAIAARGNAGNHDALYGELYHRATLDEYQWLLRTAWKLTPTDSLAQLGSGLEAHRSVVTAVACFAVSKDSYPAALARALSLGNDTDTVMGMTGAISGAHLGIGAVPPDLLARMENGERGREAVATLAARLFEKFLQTSAACSQLRWDNTYERLVENGVLESTDVWDSLNSWLLRNRGW